VSRPLVFFDLETGGLNPAVHPVIQLAAIAVDEWGHELDTFEQKIVFSVADCDPAALEINHYDEATWKKSAIGAQSAAAIFSEFLRPFAWVEMRSKRGSAYRVARLVGHNAATFDGPFLQQMFKRAGVFLPADPRVLCTVQRALWWFSEEEDAPSIENFKLETLCDFFGVTLSGAHDALADVRATVKLWVAIASRPAGERS
jgi:DNA polymerase III epsilon subunit-like protein